MNDVLKDFGASGAAPAVSTYAHPLSDAIRKECTALLTEIPEGRRLLALAQERNYKIDIISGKEPDFQITSPEKAVLICPMNTKAVDLEIMALDFGLALRGLEQPSLGIAPPNPLTDGPNLRSNLFKHMLDITLEICKIVSEFEDVKNTTKLVDYVTKLGHSELYRGFRSGKSQEELTKIYSVSVKAV